jgi:hypothetical protein
VALSDDQKAMLRLLAQREQGYEDMAALMGVSVEDLRGRVKDALGQLEREGEQVPALPEPPVEPKEAPVPKAEPAPAPPVVPAPPVESEPPDLSATPPAGQVPPALPPQSPKGARGGNGDGRKPGFSLSSNGAKVAVAAIVGAVVIVVVILLVSGGGGNDSSTGQETTVTANGAEDNAENAAAGGSAVQEAEEAAEATPGQKEPTKAILAGDSEAHGVAIFGRVNKKQLALQFVAEGLEALPKGQAYTIWVAASPQKMLPLALSPVNAEGKIASQFEVTNELLGYLATEVFDEIAVTRVSAAKLNESLKEATKKGESPSYTGIEVMRGKITGAIVGAAKRLEEQEKAKEGGKAGE